jgi:hypothetical protein
MPTKNKRKKSTKRKTASRTKKRTTKKKQVTKKKVSYVVQVQNANTLRKDVLEALREVILFMQSYEQFKAVQSEKTTLFYELKAMMEDINHTIQFKLRPNLPKGKLKLATRSISVPRQNMALPTDHPLQKLGAETPVSIQEAKEEDPKSDLKPLEFTDSSGRIDELESQLQEIERQLGQME